ncbi:MAG: aquaporin [Bacteroidetes bacterium]|nr:aquaporin [Bacteroidota bacterium]
MNKLLTELIGTFFLVLTIGLVVSSGTPLAALAIGSALTVMIYMGGHVSGAHYNPAVTLGVMMRGKIESAEAIKYMVAQVAGALLAAFASLHLTGGDTFAPAPGTGVSVAMVLLAELLFTFALVLVVLQTATNDKTAGNSYYGLAIGFTVMVGAFAVGDISGGAFNPAVAIGSIVVNSMVGSGSFADLWLYLVGPFAGGALAAVVYKVQSA